MGRYKREDVDTVQVILAQQHLDFCLFVLFDAIDLDSLSNLFLLRRQGALGLENPSKFKVGCAQKSLRTTALINSVPLLWNLSDHKQRGSTSQYRHHVINSVHGGVKTHPVIISSPQALSGDNPATPTESFFYPEWTDELYSYPGCKPVLRSRFYQDTCLAQEVERLVH